MGIYHQQVVKLTLVMILVKNTSTEHAAIAVSSVIDRESVGQVIDEGELRSISLIVAGDQEVHLIGIPCTQVVCKVLSGEVSSGFWAQLVAISHLVQQNVLGDVLDELNGVSGISHGRNHQRVGDFVDLVFI